jgi:hypothetical protein
MFRNRMAGQGLRPLKPGSEPYFWKMSVFYFLKMGSDPGLIWIKRGH